MSALRTRQDDPASSSVRLMRPMSRSVRGRGGRRSYVVRVLFGLERLRMVVPPSGRRRLVRPMRWCKRACRRARVCAAPELRPRGRADRSYGGRSRFMLPPLWGKSVRSEATRGMGGSPGRTDGSRSPFPESNPGSFKHRHSSGDTIRETGDGQRETSPCKTQRRTKRARPAPRSPERLDCGSAYRGYDPAGWRVAVSLKHLNHLRGS